MTSIRMTSHFMTSCHGVHFSIECVNRHVPKTCKVSIRYVSWFTRYATTLIIFRMTLVHPAELQLNKANTSDKETSFLDLNIKVIGSDIHTSVYDKRDDFGFPIVNIPWLSGDVPRLP